MKKCTISGKCGACKYLEVPYAEQLSQKKKKVERLFPGIRVEPVLGMKNPYHYRHKVYAAIGYDEKGKLKGGLFEEKSHRIVFTDTCLIQNIEANHIIDTFCRIAYAKGIEPYDEDLGIGVLRYLYLRVSHETGDVLLTIVIGSKFLPSSKEIVAEITKECPQIKAVTINYNHGHDSMVLSGSEKVVYGNGTICDTIDGVSFTISSRSFYQVNPVQTEVLYAKAIELADLGRDDMVLDACCGIGTISLLAARHCAFVLGVEINEQAVKDARKNAELNHIGNCRFEAMDAERFIMRLGESPDVVFLDPPRAGLSYKFLSALGRLEPKKIVYVSCNPVTQARDIEILREYGYRIRKCVPCDMFPHTEHIENILLLENTNKNATYKTSFSKPYNGYKSKRAVIRVKENRKYGK